MSSAIPEKSSDPHIPPEVAAINPAPKPSGFSEAPINNKVANTVLPVMNNVTLRQKDIQYLTASLADGGINELVLPKGKGGGDAVGFLSQAENKKHDFVVYYSGSLQSWAVMFRERMGIPIPLSDPVVSIQDQISGLQKKISEENYKLLNESIKKGQYPFAPSVEPSRLQGTIYKDAAAVLAKSIDSPPHREMAVNTAFLKNMVKSLKVVSQQSQAEKRLQNPQSKDVYLLWSEGASTYVMFKDQIGQPYLLKESESYQQQIKDLPSSVEFVANGKKIADDDVLEFG